MNQQTKSVIVANDIVGLGKVALSTGLPILSACQIEVIPLPTVLLSSHTGGFDNIGMTPLGSAMNGFLEQWETINFPIDGIMTGYLGAQEQLDLVSTFAARRQIPRFIDPIMADNGRLYTGYTTEFVSSMRHFCRGADVITPNITEACLLADFPYLGGRYGKADIERLLVALNKLEVRQIIVTGVSFDKESIGVAYFNRETEKISYHMSKAYPHRFFGTGDLLTAVIGAGYFHGLAMEKIIEVALNFLDKILQHTLALKRDVKFGLCYEPYLSYLIQQVENVKEECR
ncbi:pyridoxamine kinase [Streptococcus sp. zg-86]|uniref:pyridoxal kinase n=1 Tax=Streptococcus zhangguiae TaxID=2664091 RepID=A0A6I4R8E9_9STRE|nr:MULTISPECIES: pyridoxamine kinase [unclassified Streptococcus]MTB63837.1 pyridoxamine kinase [Streptococcus sp. zg-86]MTB90147.1 pyridoxamine kinase [Streptococcus sp. zg-36]MWV55819.1 pyridoxamine kinase [Streptococcus sp. zg-70]QTH47898.1 pyridoxamine kinase [Streptococcus sp. zg-86]